jgi:hypothetical protein
MDALFLMCSRLAAQFDRNLPCQFAFVGERVLN